VPAAPGGRITSTNPDRISEMVAEVALGDAATFAAAARAARAAQPGWADVPAPVRGRAIAHIGRVGEENAESLARLVTSSRRSGVRVLDQFTRWQSVNCDYSGRRQKAQMDVADLVPDRKLRLTD
jgi:acyl-CoA reductase-like NAD-dependent aldehyde dehydrogenase